MRVRRYTYPDNWKQISHDVRSAADWKCQRCGAPHGEFIQRYKANPGMWQICEVDTPSSADWSKAVKVRLSVHHIGVSKPDGSPGDSRDKADCRPENLIALCARCHLLADSKIAIKHARETKLSQERQRYEDAGQLKLFSE